MSAFVKPTVTELLALYGANVISRKELRVTLGMEDDEPVKDHGFRVGGVVQGDDFRILPVGAVVETIPGRTLTRLANGSYETPSKVHWEASALFTPRTIVSLP